VHTHLRHHDAVDRGFDHGVAGFLALQLVLTARSGAPLRLMGQLASHVPLFASACLVFLCISASLLQPDTLDYSARAHSISACILCIL
jgi:hypothetical protein